MKNRLAIIVGCAVMLMTTLVFAVCDGDCENESRPHTYYCQNPDQCEKRHYEQAKYCDYSIWLDDGCKDPDHIDYEQLNYTDYDGYAISSGSSGWYCMVNGSVTYCGSGQSQNCGSGAVNCTLYGGSGCVCTTWGTGTRHMGLKQCTF